MTIETRSVALQIRAASGRTLEGYAAVFDQPTRIADLFTETVKPGAFTASLASGSPIVLLAHHDMAQPLARSGQGGTLELRQDDKGLWFRATVAATSAGNDVMELARAGVLGGCSFGFAVPEGGDAWPSADTRELLNVNLVEVSVVVIPAYAEAKISARARQHASPTSRRAHTHRLAALEL